MSFVSPRYFLFLPASAVVYRLCPERFRVLILLAASLFFYFSSDYPAGFLLCLVILLTWSACLLIAHTTGFIRTLILAVTLAGCCGLLIYFKLPSWFYAALFGHSPASILLPAGISFYSFQAMSCVIDVYRGKNAEKNLSLYALYLCFFPQLVAGPIERSEHLIPQLRMSRTPNFQDLKEGLYLLISGYFRKVVIADFCSPFVDRIFSMQAPAGSVVLLGSLLFSLQIYGDFAGYSEIAAGSAKLFGITLMRNFDRPYQTESIQEFWRRWHISLSRWLTDYIYIPLGGSQKGTGRRLFATLTVFLASGLWHGGDLSFILWGLSHSLLVCAGFLVPRKAFKESSVLIKQVRQCVTFLLVSLLWIFFRAPSATVAFFFFNQLVTDFNVTAVWQQTFFSVTDLCFLLLILVQEPFLNRLAWGEGKKRPADLTLVYTFCVICGCYLLHLTNTSGNAFIYFQF